MILSLFFLGGVNFFNMHYYYILVAFFMCVFLNARSIKIDISFLLLVLFSLSYLCFEIKEMDTISMMIKPLMYPMCYLIGRNFLKVDKSYEDRISCDKEFQLICILIIISMGPFIHYILNMLENSGSIYRNTIDIWTGEILSATGQAALAIMAIAIFATGLFSSAKVLPQIASAIGVFIILAYNMVLAGRTLILLTVVVLLVAFTLSIRMNSNNRRRGIFIGVTLTTLTVLIIYVQNHFGIREWILGSNLSNRFDSISLFEDARTNYKILYLKNMLNYPFGGGYLHEHVGSYAHELYLDVYSDIGFIGYILIIGFVMFSVACALALVKSNNLSNNLRIMITCLYIIVLFEFMLEPVIQGIPWLLNLFCFISGVLACFAKNINNEIQIKEKSVRYGKYN